MERAITWRIEQPAIETSLPFSDRGLVQIIPQIDVDGNGSIDVIVPFTGANLPTGASALLGLSGSRLFSTSQLASGSGWGPGDISLRPVLSPTIPAASFGDARVDDYARLLVGRVVDPTMSPDVAVAEEEL